MKSVSWPLRSRLLLALTLGALVVVVAAAQEQAGRGDAPGGQGAGARAGGARGGRGPTFTGTTAFQPTEGMNMSRIRFDAGARTYWHTHTAPQILLIEDGRGRWQEQGDVVKDIPQNQPVLTKPNVPHWHGAAPDSHAVQFSVYAGGLTWLQAVTDEEYAGKRK
jgi:quercetin dioxygenase-like cupin family protein